VSSKAKEKKSTKSTELRGEISTPVTKYSTLNDDHLSSLSPVFVLESLQDHRHPLSYLPALSNMQPVF
jgi:hypothetical protein